MPTEAFKIVFKSFLRYERIVFWFAFAFWLLTNLMLFVLPDIVPPDQRWSDLHAMASTERLLFAAWLFAVLMLFLTSLNLVGHVVRYVLHRAPIRS